MSFVLNIGIRPIYSQKEVKLLGVVFDHKLTYKEHIAKVFQKGFIVALELKQLKNLRLKSTQLLFKSTVAQVVDYAFIIWSPRSTKLALKTPD